MKIQKLLLLLLIPSLAGCDVMANRLANVGRPPEFNKVKTYSDYTEQEQYLNAKNQQAVNNNGYEITNSRKPANSLWKPGSRAFFRDQRARAIGDILKVTVTIQDKAKLDNKTTRARSGTASTGVPNLFGFDNKLKAVLPDKVNPSKLISIDSSDDSSGEGKVDRKEDINTTVAATVIKILPNNNLYIKGTQEIRVNFEVREVTVEGIVRPEDISAENSVTLDQIAEARVSYGGRGQISDYQQERYGKQVLDIISPF